MLAYGWSNLNIYRSLSYYVPRYKERNDSEGMGAALFKVTALSLVPTSVIGLGIYWQSERIVTLLGRPDAAGVVALLVPIFWILLARDILSELFRGYERIRYIVYVRSLCYPLIHFGSFITFVVVL